MSYIPNTAPSFKQLVRDIFDITKLEVSDIDAFVETLEAVIYKEDSIQFVFKKGIKPEEETLG